jgi:hypothetical protein
MKKHNMRHLQKHIFKMLQVTTSSLHQTFLRLTLQALKFKRNKFLEKVTQQPQYGTTKISCNKHL